MRLKRLELIGFKSFAQKTTLDFPSGITAIVGPNGSGKSNITNAISWLLGEREASSLRGSNLKDLIFTGTPKRSPLSLAQASILLDTPDLPGDKNSQLKFSEVAIARKISRDGDSGCFINQSEVRLKDLVDFLARARLGIRGTTIVNQGESDIFLRANPQERREMIEEILGLSELQLKRAEAERKLENTNINIDKIRTLINELTPHLRLLRRQTQRWEQRKNLETKLKDLERIYFSNSFLIVNKGIKELKNKKDPIEENLNEKESELRGIEKKLNQLEKDDSKDFQEIFYLIKQKEETFNAKKMTLLTALGKIEVRLELTERKNEPSVSLNGKESRQILSSIKDFINFVINETDLKEIKSRARKLKEIFQNLIPKVNSPEYASGLLQEKEKVESELEKIEIQLTSFRKEENELLNKKEESSKSLRFLFQEIEAKKNEIRGLEQKLNSFNLEKERLNFKLRDWEDKIKEAKWERKYFEESVLATDANYPDQPDLEKKIFKLKAILATIGEVDEQLLKEAHETGNRYQFLTNQLEDLEKSSKDLIVLSRGLKIQIHDRFAESLKFINEEFDKFFKLMFGGGRAKLTIQKPFFKNSISDVNQEVDADNSLLEEKNTDEQKEERDIGLDIEVNLPRKRIKSLSMLSGGERVLVSIAALFSLISVSPPPFLVLDEIDAALDEKNAKKFAEIIKGLSHKTQFVLITHNRATMEAANVLYGITMAEDGVSKVLSLKLEG